ncbi:MAG: flagellar type III secretion system pore protein FliP [Clostridiales bacterium]|nr:flagellar type III secretion system pore protein FliP [Clostridiales bacterium]
MIKKIVFLTILLSLFIFSMVSFADQVNIEIPNVDLNITAPETASDYVGSIKILILMTVLTLVPSIVILMTSFTRIIIVLSLMRSALATQQTPPNQILVGLALFLTLFIMAPVYTNVIDNAINPYLAETITQEEAIEIGSKPIKDFMIKQTREKDLMLFEEISGSVATANPDDIKFTTLIPAFVISELKTAFQMGFMIFIPFIVIDLIVASILMSMGMFMLPPVMISLPFKLLLFVMVDGWYLIVKSLVESFV